MKMLVFYVKCLLNSAESFDKIKLFPYLPTLFFISRM